MLFTFLVDTPDLRHSPGELVSYKTFNRIRRTVEAIIRCLAQHEHC